MSKNTGLRTLIVALALTTTPSLAAERVGEAVVIRQQVVGDGVVGNRPLSPSDAIFMNEVISAGEGAHGELQLTDDSKIIVGENSAITLDRFVVGETGFSAGTMKVLKGAFRMVSGNSPKGAFRLKTPISTIGVRGTIFDIYVDEGVERFVLFSGSIQVCTNAGLCQTAVRSCDVIEVTSPTGIEKKPFFKSAKSQLGNSDVRLATGQRRYSKSWRAPVRACNARAAMEAQTPGQENDVEPDRVNNESNDNRGKEY